MKIKVLKTSEKISFYNAIEKVEELEHNNVGIFTIDGDTMCKQYMIVDGNVILHPFNSAYDDIIINDSMQFIIQGKVIDKQ